MLSVCHEPAEAYAGQIVATALARSFTPAQVAPDRGPVNGEPGATVWINPPPGAAASLAKTLRSGGKAVVLGRLNGEVADVLGLDFRGDVDLPCEWADCQIGSGACADASPATIAYTGTHALARQSPLAERPLCRFDFANEWNNLGFGRITLDRSPWSVASAVAAGDAASLAQLSLPDGPPLLYAALAETEQGAALWFNREVGPVDSLEWRVLEAFLGDYRPDDLPCFPYVSEIPAGYSAAVCARLDCDEAIGSARDLWELYRSHGLPLSLAVVTGLALDDADRRLLGDVVDGGGAAVSHSVRHLPNWGGSYEQAHREASESREWLAERLGQSRPRFAVSPFHQNPPYAVAALADCGYEGFVAGTIASDPEYLLGRAGRVPFAPRPIVSHSAQCMLHGDCYHRYRESIGVYCQSFDQHRTARAIFGYLDHPFSARYQYGWRDEAQRLAAHRGLIEHVGRERDVWWASVDDVLGFLRLRDAALVNAPHGGTLSVEVAQDKDRPPLAIHWKGCQFDY